MATKKKLLQAAAGSAGGAGALNVEDVFSNYIWDGNARTQSIHTGINLGQSNSGGSARFVPGNPSGFKLTNGADFDFGLDDFTWECWVWHDDNSGASTFTNYDIYYSQNCTYQSILISRQGSTNEFGIRLPGGSLQYSTATIPKGQWVHLAVVVSSTNAKCYIDGTLALTHTPSTRYDCDSTQDPWIGNFYGGGTYGMEGYMSNLRIVKGSQVYTSNFTPPTSPLTAISGTVLLTFQNDDPFTDNSGQSNDPVPQINVHSEDFGPFDASEAGEGGLVWIKSRNNTSQQVLVDTERGVNKYLRTNGQNAETSASTVTAFNKKGFNIGSSGEVNEGSGWNFSSWTFRKAPKFFDIVTWTGDGATSRTINHNLGHDVGFMVVKKTSDTSNWHCWHRSSSIASAANGYGELNFASSWSTYTGLWDDTAPTSTSFTVNNNAVVNESGAEYVAYLFAHHDGDGTFGVNEDQDIISCGGYSGNGTDKTLIDLGWEPQWLLLKRIDSGSTGDWTLIDNLRGFFTRGGGNPYFSTPNSSGAESNTSQVFGHRQGFVVDNGNFNTSGEKYIYMAIRRGPMGVPTDARDVFNVVEGYQGDGYAGSPEKANLSIGFPPDLTIANRVSSSNVYGSTTLLSNKLRDSGRYLLTYAQNTESSAYGGFVTYGDYQEDFQVGDAGGLNDSNYAGHFWNFRRNQGFLDCLIYTGSGSATTIEHNLGVVPEMIWVKNLDVSQDWAVYHVGSNDGTTPEQYPLRLNNTGAQVDSTGYWNDTAPTETVFSIGTNARVNDASNDYLAVLFSSVEGVSKLGNYTGTAADINIDCGFSNGARFVLIKRTDSAGEWWVLDTVRGIATGNDSIIAWSGGGENSGTDRVDPYSGGFTVKSTASTDFNASGGKYIYYAIA